jgi:hypothetical protein
VKKKIEKDRVKVVKDIKEKIKQTESENVIIKANE